MGLNKMTTIVLTCPNCKLPVWRYFKESITVYQQQHAGNWVEANRDKNTLDRSEVYYWCQSCDELDMRLPDGVKE